VRPALVLLLFGLWPATAGAQTAPAEPPPASEAPTAAEPTPSGADGTPAPDEAQPPVEEGQAPEADEASAAPTADGDEAQADAAEGVTTGDEPAAPAEPSTTDAGGSSATEPPASGNDFWKGAQSVPGEQPSVQGEQPAAKEEAPAAERPSPARPTPLQAPRSDPYLSIGASAGACAAASCLGPVCTVAGLSAAFAWLFVSPAALFGIAPCISGGLACGGLGGGLCATGVGGSAAATGASAAVPYFEADETDAAWDAAVGGLPAVLLAAAAFLVLPVSLGVAFLAVDRALLFSGAALSGELITALLVLAVVPLGVLPAVLMGACAPVLALVGTSAARMQYASSGPESALVVAAPPVPRPAAVAMRY
jgi:hypothetical protein